MNESEHEIPYDEYPQYPVVIEVNESPHADDYRERLTAAGFEHLERDII
ncbi:MAG: hypothetical protein ACRDV3_16005 [Acidothermaceae bacterium]